MLGVSPRVGAGAIGRGKERNWALMQRSEPRKEEKNLPRHKLGKGNPDKQPEPQKNKPTEVFVGNLPVDIKEKELALLFKDFGVKSVKKCQSPFESFVFVEMVSPQAVQQAIQQLNGHLLNGRCITVAAMEDRKVHQLPKDSPEMPDLELVPHKELGSESDAVLKTGTQNPPPLMQKVHYAVPMEMRTLFLLHMLKDCFKDASWLFSVAKITGKVRLLVLESIPQTPYFWAVNLTEECHQKMQKLFTELEEAASPLPFLAKKDAQRGMRCLAECIVGDKSKAWNRCWVLDKIEGLAVVFFVDFGHSATIPVTSLRKLDADEFWSVGPLAQPFMLQDDVLPPQVMTRQIWEGTVVGPLQREPHILTFVRQAS